MVFLRLWGQSATRAGEFVDEPLQCCLGMRCEGSIVSEEHVTHQYSIGVGVSHFEEFSVGTGMEVHTVCGGVKGIGQEEREEDSRVSGLLRQSLVHAALYRGRI